MNELIAINSLSKPMKERLYENKFLYSVPV